MSATFRCAAAVLLLAAAAFAAQPEKNIRLRNEQIITVPTKAAASKSAVAPPASGLFLIQFEKAPTPAQRDQLAALGVDLLSYIPDDAFIAALDQVPPGQLRALPFVRWVGPFKPEHKIHGKLAAAAAPTGAPGGDVDVSVLLAPRAKPTDAMAARRRFTNLTGQSDLREGTILRGRLPTAQIQQIAASPAVLWIEPSPHMKLNDEIATKIVAGDDGFAGTLATVQQLGFNGAGVNVAVADSGLDSGDTNAMHPDIAGRVTALFHYGALDDAADEHSHGTHCAGIIAGNAATGEVDAEGFLYGLGVAPGASLIAQRIFDAAGGYTYTNASFEKLTRDAKSAGADIGSNSWGDDTQGRYDLNAMEFDALVRDAVSDAYAAGDQPYILEFSAGNAGPGGQTIGSPAVAKNVIATGAAQNNRPDLLVYGDGPDAMADFSSRGPCEDGRIKPDVTAPGTWIASLRSIYANDENAWGEISPNYMYQGGTSQAGPHVAGAAAVFVQYWRASHTNATPSPALVKAALINSATDMDETAIGSTVLDENGDPIEVSFPQDPNPAPNMDEGWGRVYLPNLIGTTRNYQFVDQSVLLTNSQVFEQRILIGSAAEPLKITLGYTDVPGSPVTVPALVNDLDLEVLAPDGHVYHGNQFSAGESIADAPAFDTINNVEGVHFAAPVPGEYTVRIRARNVVMDARRDTSSTIDQDFALVVSGRFAAPGTGIVTFDRRVYTAPATMKLRLVDYDLAGQPAAGIVLRSSTETNGENITLQAYGTLGVFTGAVATATGPAITDGRLQVQHTNLITAIYQDASQSTQRVFTARTDLLPPVISGVFTTNRFGRTQIHWQTDEPAASLVLYGTNTALGLAETNLTYETDHVVAVPNQIPGQTNYFKLICADEAGNVSTNSNGGTPYQFVVPYAPAILLVDAFNNDLFFDPPPDLAGYTTALDQLGLAYDVWDTSVDGSPALADLQPFRVVLWRLPEASSAQPTLSSAEQTALTQYLNGGGGLFIASMEAVSRLDSYGGTAFRQNVLHVASYVADGGLMGVEEVPGDAIGDAVFFDADFTEYLGGFGDFSDTITPGPGATGILRDVTTGKFVGLSYPRIGVDSPGRVIYLSFPFDAIPTDTDAPGNRAALLRRMLVFLAPGLNGEGSVAFNQSAYSVPAQATVELADSDLSGLGQMAIKVASGTQTNGVTLNLQETTRRGVFRGSLALVKTNAGSTLPELRVTPGDNIRADYFDASLNVTVSAIAPVETNAPVITGISVEPSYLEAVVSWDTDELADSLVEFGNSPLLGRTAFDATPTDIHTVTLPQLEANRTYYFRIVSKDRAGNVAVNDNGGAMHTFTTLQPLLPPWADNLEHGNTNWTVYTVEDSERGWELGPPGILSPPAHSPDNAWGSNLSGDYASAIESYLISPAIQLTGGNTATLKFWHAYDFTMPSDSDIFHAGELLLLTGDALEPISLGVYSENAVDWEPVEVDLTPYNGQIVYIAWHYFLFSLDSLPRTGWLVDDVSITVSNTPTGTLIVSNNLWQASYTLDGAPHAGRLLVISNAPAGLHTIAYNPVPFYTAPPAQTNTLLAGATTNFAGNYTFTDANTNGIADAWEQARFGAVSPTRTATTDTDGDGMSDYAEFIAGTNPNDPLPPFRITSASASNGEFNAVWTTVPGYSYRVLNTTNLAGWSPLSAWILAGGTHTNYSTALSSSTRQFRVETTNTTGLQASLSLTATRQANALRMDWNSVPGRAYRLLSASNLDNWTPVSAWVQTNTFTVSPLTNTPKWFRLEVAP